jgi:hypothetical protein
MVGQHLMKNLLLTAATAALLALTPAIVFAQDTSTSGATSGSASNAQNSANNGGVTVGPTTVGPVDTASTSNSTSGANSGSASNAVNGGQNVGNSTSGSTATSDTASNSASMSQGGNASSDAHSTGGTSSATGGTGGTGGSSNAAANNAASNAGNQQNINFNTVQPAHVTETVRSVPQVFAPALTTTLTETCMGSTSAGGSGVGFGFSVGSTWRDAECVRRLNARELAQTIGDPEAARAVLCGSKMVEEAYDRIGRPCPQSPNYKSADASAYMPQRPVPPQPVSPVVINVPPPAPAAAATVMMAPIPNPPAAPYAAPHRHHAVPHKRLKCPASDTGEACPVEDEDTAIPSV